MIPGGSSGSRGITAPAAHRVLIGCEYSATVRDAFRARGFDAWSCDILPTEGEPRIHRMPPGPDRWKERSRTFAGIAEAMADQWGGYLNELSAARKQAAA